MTNGINVIGDGSTNDLLGTGGDDSFSGSYIGERIYTGLGNDVVFAGGGNDTVFADMGNDWFEGSDGKDLVSFTYLNYINGSTFVVNAHGVTVDLDKKTPQNLGYLGTKTILGFEDMAGSVGNDHLYGSKVANFLYGAAGNDLFDSRGGNDAIEGSTGKDTIIGGAGADELAGYAIGAATDEGDRDVFVYKAVSDSGITAATHDTIWGFFNGGGATGDRIDLHAIDANGSASGNGTFHFIGTHGFHANSTGEVRVKPTANANEYLVQIDNDAHTDAEMSILVHSLTALVKGDFIL